MKIKYIGTAAAEAIPAMFCECSFCKNARMIGGREIRKRSGVVIDDELMIDFSPDVNAAFMEYGLKLSDIKNIIFTHSHQDHACVTELEFRRSPSYCLFESERENLHIYGNGEVEKLFKTHFPSPEKSGLDFTFIKPFTGYKIGSFEVTPLSVVHCPPEDAYIYLIEKGEKRFLYGNDTTMLTEDVFDFLSKKHIDVVSLDCTMGGHGPCSSHMNFVQNVAVRERFLKTGTADEKTVFISHHFSHNGLRTDESLLTYDVFSELAAPNGFLMSYDGMEVIS